MTYIDVNNTTYRSVQPQDGPKIVEFLNSIYDNWGNIYDWRWKYLDPPAPFRFDNIIAESGDKIVGHYGLLPLEAITDGHVISAAQGIDAAVSPLYRRKGVYTNLANQILTRAAHAGIKFIYAFPGLLSIDVNLQHGYQVLDFVPEMFCPINLSKALKLILTNLPSDLKALRSFSHRKQLSPSTKKKILRLWRTLFYFGSFFTSPNLSGLKNICKNNKEGKIFKINHFDERFDSLWQNYSSKLPLAVCKHACFLNWRYFSSPTKVYCAYGLEVSGSLAGYMVVKSEGHRLEIAELFALPEYTSAVSSLIQTAWAIAKNNNKTSLHIWANDKSPNYGLLRQAGFIPPTGLHKLAKHWKELDGKLYRSIIYTQHLPADQQADLMLKIQALQFSKGDSDLI